jgi:hypothetical protein
MANRAVLLKIIFLLVLICTVGIVSVFAQEEISEREDMWVCPVAEASFYSLEHPAFGGGAALGYGNGVSFGLKVVYSSDLNGVSTIELNLLVRLYLFGLFRSKAANPEDENAIPMPNSPHIAGTSGLFIQFNGGPVIFAQNEDSIAVPSQLGAFSAGLCLGWRFLLGRTFFIEPVIRGGYPYIVGAGLSAGVRF